MPTRRTPLAVQLPQPTADASMRLERLSADPVAATWFDLAGSNDGTPSDPTILSDFVFDGIADHVDTFGASGIGPAADWTVSMWASRDHTYVGRVLLAQTRAGATGAIFGRDLDAAAVGPLRFETFGAVYTSHFIIPAATDSDFHHFAFVWEAATPRITVYQDGQQVYASPTNTYTVGGPWILGGDGSALFWKGGISSFRVYPRQLSADELARDFAAGRQANQ